MSWQDTQVSVFANAIDVAPCNVTIREILADIKDGVWARQIEAIREIYAEAFAMKGLEAAKKAVSTHKKRLPGFLASGTFSGRNDEDLIGYSGLLCVDLDRLDDIEAVRAKLANDKLIAAFFGSPTWSGLKVIMLVRPDAGLHLRSFRAAREHFRRHYGLAIDDQCRNVARLCFVSHDPNLFMRNGDAQILEPVPEQESAPPPESNSGQRADGSGDAELTPLLRSRIEKYLATVAPAIQGEHGNKPTYRVACVLVWGFSLSIEDAKPFMVAYSQRRCVPPWSAKEIDRMLLSARNATDHKDRRGHLLGRQPEPESAGGGSNGKLTMLTISEILAIEDDPSDILLSNGYIEKGAPFVFCGPPGIGKSRIAMQLAIQSVLRQRFLDTWGTNAVGLRWAFLQNENGNRRLRSDLVRMVSDLSAEQRKALDKNILTHCIVTDIDGHLDLSDPEALKRVREVVQDWKPDIVVGDPLTAFGVGDLNSDKDMLQTARGFGRVVKEGDPRRTPGLLHHARTGKEAVRGLSGYDRSSFGRNSKVLFGWTRSQFNMASANEADSDRLFFASGKCNNFREFEEFIIGLDVGTMFYSPTGDDPKAAREDLMGDGGKFKQKWTRKHILDLMSATIPRQRKDIKMDAMDKVKMSDGSFNALWKQLQEFEEIIPTEDGKWLKK